MSDLNQVLRTVCRGFETTYEWPKPSADELGIHGDFEVLNHGPIKVFIPISDAGIKWVVENVPEWVDRYGRRGFSLDSDEMDQVISAAERDGLTDIENYAEKARQEWWQQQDGELS